MIRGINADAATAPVNAFGCSLKPFGSVFFKDKDPVFTEGFEGRFFDTLLILVTLLSRTICVSP